MPGLVPGIHAWSATRVKKNVDGRDKPGHDELSLSVSIFKQRDNMHSHSRDAMRPG